MSILLGALILAAVCILPIILFRTVWKKGRQAKENSTDKKQAKIRKANKEGLHDFFTGRGFTLQTNHRVKTQKRRNEPDYFRVEPNGDTIHVELANIFFPLPHLPVKALIRRKRNIPTTPGRYRVDSFFIERVEWHPYKLGNTDTKLLAKAISRAEKAEREEK